ncbi:ABC transporter ATP-binding protein [Ornithinibacillus halotolerans]|uniref:ABC transporter ATP-binding protein n=1 Tax=Ornithinibacillus halotolerans TaxID=1274357 RepID=A0A916W6V7_9BACI|nr:ABC transporter ATP-binding protein [Ornithinibacillus halotolerans]GGA72153.1 ABC transporter ATP-binding protein [Ornithinibacillus halotolerans]
MEPVINVQNVSKQFKNKTAVDEVSFSIQKGEVVAILGPNGAGKTTTMLMMLGLLKPTQGRVQLLNKHPQETDVREKIGVMLQEVSVIDALSVREVLELFRSYYPNPLSIQELVELTRFTNDELKKRANKLSGGQQRRLGFALAMAGNPEVLFFDEPTVGLDVTSRKVFWNTVEKLKNQGKTIIFTTHYLQEADDIAERVILFHHGKIIGDGKPNDIKAALTKQSVSFTAKETFSFDHLHSLPGVTDVYEKDGRVYLITKDIDLVLSRLFSLEIKLENIEIERGRLEDAFEQLTESREGA